MATIYRDSHGKRLIDYDRPSVAVDIAVLSVDPELGLVVLEVRRDSGTGWALPGTFLWKGEVLAQAVERCLLTKANLTGLAARQLRVFDGPDRDPRGWVLSVAHVAVVNIDRITDRFPAATRLVPVDAPGRLIYDHNAMIELAVADLRARYEDKADPDHLLGQRFTLRELRQLHEVIGAIGHGSVDTFRRNMEAQLVATDRLLISESGGRPARLFRRRRD
ncbi:MAG: NUDIX hydrolase [Mycobacterium sp.]|nr:NUDIX hydrolase [Mycobacterium sp.]